MECGGEGHRRVELPTQGSPFCYTCQAYGHLSRECSAGNGQGGRAVIEFLGHIITPTGIQPCPSKVAAIRDYPRPRNSKEGRHGESGDEESVVRPAVVRSGHGSGDADVSSVSGSGQDVVQGASPCGVGFGVLNRRAQSRVQLPNSGVTAPSPESD
ncbi:uncharacterized protein [Palaemon carinicauda]|uniref:uncharacterized protein n=1 Tax=Palaemon carinicauda TaxID=392227 RepID=UPI0035B62397